MPTERKIAQVEELRSLIEAAEIAISTDYQGISVADQVELRAALTEAGARMRVVKNTLLRIAARDAGLDDFAALADGPTALVVGHDEPLSAAKALSDYLKARPNSPVKIRRAIVSGDLVDAAYVEDLASVPPREELLARIAGGLVGQLTQLILLLQATVREFAGLVESRAVQLEESGEGAPAAEESNATEEAPAAEADAVAEDAEASAAGEAEADESGDAGAAENADDADNGDGDGSGEEASEDEGGAGD